MFVKRFESTIAYLAKTELAVSVYKYQGLGKVAASQSAVRCELHPNSQAYTYFFIRYYMFVCDNVTCQQPKSLSI